MTHTTRPAAQLRAEIAEREAALAAMEAEPDTLLQRYDAAVAKSYSLGGYHTGHGLGKVASHRERCEQAEEVKKLRAELVEALAPRQAEAMDEAWVERTAQECARNLRKKGQDGCLIIGQELEAARAAIRATLKRAPRWPGDAELREMVNRVGIEQHYSVKEGAWEMARRLREWQTGGAAKPEPEWIDWHGGECPVPAGTRVEVEIRLDGSKAFKDTAGELLWGEHGNASIKRYRILGEQA
jgi:hypothetical protein